MSICGDIGCGGVLNGRTFGLTKFCDRFRGPLTSLQAEHPQSRRREEQHIGSARGQGDDGEDRSRFIIEEEKHVLNSKNLAL